MRTRQSTQQWKDYGVALLATTAAAAVRAALPGPLTGTPFLAFYPAVAIAAMRGFGPGMVATVVSSVCYAMWFSPHPDGFHLHNSVEWLRLGIFLAGGAGVGLIGHRQRLAQARERQRTEDLQKSESEVRRQKDLLAVTLGSIGDGVMVTDVQGRVTFLNAEAERLTGWTSATAEGQPLASVFKIINEQTRQSVESPADKVLRLGTVVGLANHTILIAKDGREIPIDDSGAPIRSADGTVQGVVLVFRDFSEQKAAENALRASEQQLRLQLAVLHSAANAIVVTSADGVVQWVNDSFTRLTGYSADEVVGHNPRLLKSGLHGPEFYRDLWQTVAGGQVWHGEMVNRRKDGTLYTEEMTITPVKDAAGQVTHFVAIKQDVSQRKRREHELQRLNRTLRALSNSSQAMLRASSEADYLTEACRIIVEDCGYALVWIGYAEQDELRTVRPVAQAGFEQGYLESLNIRWTDDTPHGRGPTGSAIRTGRPHACRDMLNDPAFAPWREQAIKRGYASSLALPLLAEGKAFGALTIYATQPDAFGEDEIRLLSELAGDAAYGIAAIRLREARAKSEASLRQSLQRVELLAGTAEELLRSRQPQRAAQMLCQRAMEHLDCHVFFNFLVDPHAGRLHLNACAGISQEEARRIEWLDYGTAVCGCAARDGCRIVAEQIPTTPDPRTELVKSYGIKAYACHPLMGPAGEVLGTLSFGTRSRETFSDSDLSLMKAVADHVATAMVRLRGEEELMAARHSAEQAKAAAEHANRAKNHFLAVLSHELRTPLAPVLATVSMLQRDLREGPVGGYDQFKAELNQSLEMIHRNVEMEARLIDDLLDVTRIERGKVELHRRPLELATVIQHALDVCRADIETRALQVTVDLKDGQCVVHADAARLQQVFWNLLKNAIKFTPRGGQIRLQCRREGQGHVTAEVSDNGPGIDPESLPRIFNAFEQAGRQITRQFGGLGLGLAISKAMVELHGGTIQAQSEGKGKGAKFIVRLPIAEMPLPPVQTAPAGTTPTPPLTSGQASRKLRILMVEDHGDTAYIMRRLLTGAGHEVMAAADIAAAIKLSTEAQFDLLLSDLGLPDGSGLDLMRNLRQRGLTLPGIALSGYGQEQDIAQSREAGFSAHLTKPIDVTQLHRTIASVMA